MQPRELPTAARQRPPDFVFKVVRTRLMHQLGRDAEERSKVLSLVAPTGYGKTVMMSALYEAYSHRGEQCIWLGLDERHASVDRFLSCFEPAREGSGHSVMSLVQGHASTERQLDDLVEMFADLPHPTTIFIDNVNACTDERLGAILDSLVFRTASSTRFVWSSTSDPDFNIGRARLEGLLRQIGINELSLGEEEVGEILGDELCEVLGPENIAAIVAHTEGWPAAIRLMQIVLEESERPLETLTSFSGTDEDIVALLKRQVMGRFSVDLQHFLLRLALLRNFTQDMCQQAIGGDGVAQHLALLLRRNVFMVPLDRNRERYRLHNLFREYLLTEAGRALSDREKSRIWQRASEWCERREEWHDAVEYALAAKDLARCQHLLQLTAGLYVREQYNVQQYVSWVQQLESIGGRICTESHFWYVWALVFQRHHQMARRELERLATHLTTAEDSDIKQSLTRRILHLQICLDLFADRLLDAEQAASRWLEMDNGDDAYASGSIRCILSICLERRFQFVRSRHTMLAAQPLLLDVGGPYTQGWISLIDGVNSALEGNVGSGYRELKAALTRSSRDLGAEAPLSCAIASVASYCAVELGEFSDARRLLAQVLPNFHTNVLVDHGIFCLEAALKIWDGEGSGLISPAELRSMVRSYPPRLALVFSCLLIQRLSVLGKIEDAEAEARVINLHGGIPDIDGDGDAGVSHPGLRAFWAAARIQMMIAKRQLRSAAILIAQEISAIKKDGRHVRLLELELASAAVSLQLGKAGLAAKALTSAVRRAAQRGVIYAFFDYRSVVSQLLRHGNIGARSFALKDESQFFSQLCARLEVSGVPESEVVSGAGTVGVEIVAPTEREVELLSLLETGLSNAEIASYANLSVTTVKWHLKNLYKKLGVNNRAAAIARSRDLGLLSR